MKKIVIAPILALTLLAGFSSCKKETGYQSNATLNMINCMVDAEIIVSDFGIDRSVKYLWESKFNRYAEHNVYAQLSLPTGLHTITTYNYPDTLSKDAALKTISIEAESADMLSLFFVGDKAHPDTMLIREEFPVHMYGDSTFSVRFLNLSYGSNPVRVEVDGTAQPLVSNLAYKARSGWHTFSARANAGTYMIRFKDQVSGNEIASYTISDAGSTGDFTPNIWRKNNVSIALIGSPAIGSGMFAPASFLVRHYFPG